jgi:hypothetical protein
LAAAVIFLLYVSARDRLIPDPVFATFDMENFGHPTTIDNQWMPLKPGTQFIFEGLTIEEGEKVAHSVVITVTDLTKEIAGVRSVVTWDQDISAGELVEAELAFFAQDDAGVVWRMGEYPEEYLNGAIVESPTWIHGIKGAHAGIAMYPDPRLDMPSYAQGWGPDVDWNDRGQVDQVGQKTCVPAGCFEDVLVISETSRSEKGAFQLKYYAPTVGNIRVGWTGADTTQETLELVQILQLSPEALMEARARALELEASAYVQSKDVYIHTPHLE